MKLLQTTCLIIIITICPSCKKDWLDAKPSQNLVIPNTIKDLQALLDNDQLYIFNNAFLGEQGADNYYVSSTVFQGRSDKDRNVYSWSNSTDFYAGGLVNDWDLPYRRIMTANIVMEQIEKINPAPLDYSAWANVKGTALFYRAFNFYQLAQLFCKTYNPSTADTDLGILIRVESDISKAQNRSSVSNAYSQIINDLNNALQYLPRIGVNKSRASKWATFAMLARVYLTMGDYDKALQFSDSCLSVNASLLNYNNDPEINPAATNPFKRYNKEVIFQALMQSSSLLPGNTGVSNVDTTLYSMYDFNDKRRTLFFRNIGTRRGFVGSYNGSAFFFAGLATDEIYLIRAEAYARKNNITAAMADLNSLYINRWNNSMPFIPYTAASVEEALTRIFNERRKELCFRGIRWTDLRRLNLDDRFKTTLTRIIGTATHILPPNDNRYVYPIPNSELLFNNIPQNPR